MNEIEILVKSKVDYKYFKDYFHQDANEYHIHNSFKFLDDRFLLSGLGFLNLFHDYKIVFDIVQDDPDYILMKPNLEGEKQIKQLVEFSFTNNLNFEDTLHVDQLLRLELEYIVVIKSLLKFYEKFKTYFTDVDNYFPIKENINLTACSTFLILKNPLVKNVKFNSLKIYENDVFSGEEIICSSSSLSVISYLHFSKCQSKGIISNFLTEDVILLDIRVVPNSHGSTVYSITKKTAIAIILPIMNVKYSYTPLIFAYRLRSLINILFKIYNENNKLLKKFQGSYESNIPLDLKLNMNGGITQLQDSVFIIYNTTHYASCFYLGDGFFCTNKHFFTNYNLDDEVIYVKNYKLTIQCRKYMIPKNNFDIAIVRAIKSEEINDLIVPLKISNKKLKILEEIWNINFSYFDKKEILHSLKLPNLFKGVITKIIERNKFDIVYGIDSASFSGGSGGPVVNKDGELVGVLFQNLTFNTSEFFLQVPHTGYIISKEIILLIKQNLKNLEALNNLWIFNLSNQEVDRYLNFNKFSPKF
jgi:hypothetical protein